MTVNEKQFFSREFDITKSKILIIGSSHVGMLDAQKIEMIINQDYYEYAVFNLAKGSDTPTKRLKQLSELLSLKPELVVYGINYRDFEDFSSYNNEHTFPEPAKWIRNLLNLELDFLNNPKLTTLNVFRNYVGVKPLQNSSLTSTPFFPYSEHHYQVMNMNEIRNFYRNTDVTIDIPSINHNIELDSLSIILKEFRENNVKVILFITPHNSEYIDGLSTSNKKNFEDIITRIEENHNIHVYTLLQNYTTLEIWSSPNHITHGDKGSIYNQDVAKIILKELEN